MDFEIPEELKMVRSLVRDFVTDQLKPLERDILGRAADMSDARMYLPREIEDNLAKTAEGMGLWGIGVPDEIGGAGLGVLGNCLVEEELSQTIIPFNFGDVTPILFEANTAQKDKYFLSVLKRQKQAYMALLELGDGSHPANMRMRARKENSHYVLDGEKVSLSRVGDDYFAIVFALTGEEGLANSVTCFIVDKDTQGFTIRGGEENTGWRSQMINPMILTFNHCPVTSANILGEEGKAFHLGKRWLPARRVVRSARCIGAGQRLLEEATVRAQTWQSFGQFIYERSDVQAALADIAINIHACRLMVYEAACTADSGESIRREASMVKVFATEMLNGIADRVTHIFNGPAFTAGLPMERLCRHAMATSATELAMELQRHLIADDILKGLRV